MNSADDTRREGSPTVLIAHHPDGSADVNGLAVHIAPGQDSREAAYLAALALVADSGPAPVAAMRVEPDGTQYPFTLYPGRTVLAADLSTKPHRAFASFKPSRVAAGACGCVFVAALAATLTYLNNTSGDRTNMGSNLANTAPGSSAGGSTQAAGADVARGTRNALTALHGPVPGSAKGSDVVSPAADAEASASSARSRLSRLRSGAHDPSRPFAAGWPPGTFRRLHAVTPVAVGDVTLALIGGQRFDPDIAYVITVSTSTTDPITLMYSYSGSRGSLTSTHEMVLSGQTEYMVSDTIPSNVFCGGTVTMQASTQPRSSTGPVTATTTQEC
ncbi:hypothetical protein KDL01_32685 [Actinospica durhamensis]|uniref:Uncharacterized protein n=1 Tax=Actinospica durhamensis TaxID=1508375 RepID=A0A941IVZ6_9ACTN|nr:hypothetical protein [Actinospica durhamensis]MBR7838076.1 hypothetical protein [Actinospica durhamensis]